MAKIIFKVVTVCVQKRLTDKALGEKMTEVVSDERRRMLETKQGGVFQNSHIQYIRGWWWRRPKYKITLSFLSFS